MNYSYVKTLCFALVATALIGFTACDKTAKATSDTTAVDETAALRPSDAITTLEDGTQVVNTTTLAADVKGYSGATPVELYIKAGRIDSILFLPHGDSEGYYAEAIEHMDWSAFEGKTLREAANAQVDAVSGATLSSNALLENVRRGIAHAIAQQEPEK